MKKFSHVVTIALVMGLAMTSVSRQARADEEKKPWTVMAPGGELDLSGTLLLFDYLPQMPASEQKFEVYAFMLNIDAATDDKQSGLHAQARFRDSKLRPFFLSNSWFQELYIYHKTPIADVHIGKVYRKVGIFWDDSFFGNVQYFNGLKLNPDYGAEVVKSHDVGDSFTFDASAQYFPNNDNVDGSLNGRDVESDPFAHMHNTATGRLVSTWKMCPKSSLALGVSALTEGIERSTATAEGFRLTQRAVDLTLTAGPSITYVEFLKQVGELDNAAHPLSRPGYDTATYFLAGTRWQVLSWLNARINYSQANYVGQDAKEAETVPGLVFTLNKNAFIMAEYDYWKLYPHGGGPDVLIDRSYNLIFGYSF